MVVGLKSLSADQRSWAARKVHTAGGSRVAYEGAILAQDGRCAWSGAKLRFDAASSRTPHPLYAATIGAIGAPPVLICVGLTQIVGRLPPSLAAQLEILPAWRAFLAEWSALAAKRTPDPEAFKRLLKR